MKTYSSSYLANEFGIDRATAVRALRGVTPDEERTRGRPTFYIATFVAALEAHRLANASNANDGSEGVSDSASLTAARVRIAVANAEAKERENRIASGEWVSGPEVISTLGAALAVMRDIMLGMPGKLSDSLAEFCVECVNNGHGDKSVADLRVNTYEILMREVGDALTAMSTPQNYLNEFERRETERMALDG